MTQTVNVPGVGTLQFPDGMSQADMAAAIQKNFPQIHAAPDPAKRGLPGYDDNGVPIVQRAPAPDTSSMWDKIKGAGEAALSTVGNIAAGTVGQIGGTLGAMAGQIATGEYGTPQGTARAADVVGNAMDRATQAIQPILPMNDKARQYAQAVGQALDDSGIAGLPVGPEMAVVGNLAKPALQQAGGMAAPVMQAVGNVASKGAGVVADTAGKGASLAGNAIAAAIGELGTHTGAQSIKDAFQAGMDGSRAFLDNMRGNVPLTDVLEKAKANLQVMGQQASKAYRDGMAEVSGDKSILSFDGIDKAVDEASKIGTYKGQVTNPYVQGKIGQVAQLVDDWRGLDPAQFHTPEGLDALKRSIGGVLEDIPFEQKSARLAVGNVYNAVKSEIADQAPTYSSVMSGYSQAADQIREIERALSLGDKASVDTAMRKLQSLTRNNANTNYGNRLDMARQLEQAGGQELLPALSGQALSSLAPRGLGKAVASGAAIASASHPAYLATLPLQSPRLMGEAAYGLGRGAGFIGDVATSMKVPPLSIRPVAQAVTDAAGNAGMAAPVLAPAMRAPDIRKTPIDNAVDQLRDTSDIDAALHAFGVK